MTRAATLARLVGERHPLVQALEAVVTYRIGLGDLPPYAALDAGDIYLSLEQKAAAAMQAQYDAVVEEIIGQLEAAGKLPADPLSRDLVLQAMRDGVGDLQEEAIAHALEAGTVAQGVVAADVIAAGVTVDTSGTLLTDTADRIRRQVLEFSKDTLAHMVGDAQAALAAAAEEGLGINDAVARLRPEFHGLGDWRLQTIARTEINGAQGLSTWSSMRAWNVTYKSWLAARDSRVRDSHRAVHGQVVKRDEKFTNGLRYPHDREGDIEEWINCRCRMRSWIPKADTTPPATPFYK